MLHEFLKTFKRKTMIYSEQKKGSIPHLLAALIPDNTGTPGLSSRRFFGYQRCDGFFLFQGQ
jgi:hypothetical protein